MSCNPCQSSSTNEVADNPRQLHDAKTSRMDLLSLNFVTLEMRETVKGESLEEVFINDNMDDKLLTPNVNPSFVEKKSSRSIERRKSRRKNSEYIEENVMIRDEDVTLNIISLNELAWHDSADDCWIAIYDYVYDCTNFLNDHPGGDDVILEYAGRDATIAFIGTGHSNGARKILEKYLIGELPINERLFRKIGGVKIVEL